MVLRARQEREQLGIRDVDGRHEMDYVAEQVKDLLTSAPRKPRAEVLKGVWAAGK